MLSLFLHAEKHLDEMKKDIQKEIEKGNERRLIADKVCG